MNMLNKNLRVMRKTPTAKCFLTGCAAAGFYHGFTKSAYNLNLKKRLLVDRLAWGSLYAGAYTWGHPIVFFYMLKNIEVKIRSNRYESGYEYGFYFKHLLDIPHGDIDEMWNKKK